MITLFWDITSLQYGRKLPVLPTNRNLLPPFSGQKNKQRWDTMI
jgi:hypothetical protein